MSAIKLKPPPPRKIEPLGEPDEVRFEAQADGSMRRFRRWGKYGEYDDAPRESKRSMEKPEPHKT